jgi:transposase
VQKTIEVDLALITYDDALLKDLELYILKTARHHDANTLYLLQTIPGIGKILSLVLLYEIHQIDRFPSVQDFASYARLVKCSKESGGKRREHSLFFRTQNPAIHVRSRREVPLDDS